ncbi:MAG: hypothetical protein K0R98_1875 [Rickettsiaceae bacterium]|jgi:hypothetical protein|nr:hypothetical protein [Rickettsiaceae bacterium]
MNPFQEGFIIVIIVLEESGQDQLPRQPKSSCRLVWVFYFPSNSNFKIVFIEVKSS